MIQKTLEVCSIEQAQLYEGRVTRKYMEEYGDNNVRGGDLTGDVEYVRRFGWIYTKDKWETVAVVVLLLLIIVALVLDRYQWDIKLLLALILWLLILQLWSKVRAKNQTKESRHL